MTLGIKRCWPGMSRPPPLFRRLRERVVGLPQSTKAACPDQARRDQLLFGVLAELSLVTLQLNQNAKMMRAQTRC